MQKMHHCDYYIPRVPLFYFLLLLLDIVSLAIYIYIYISPNCRETALAAIIGYHFMGQPIFNDTGFVTFWGVTVIDRIPAA